MENSEVIQMFNKVLLIEINWKNFINEYEDDHDYGHDYDYDLHHY